MARRFLGSLPMGSSANQAAKQVRTLQRNSARAAILEAARLLTAQQGTTEVSLSAVATEAGFAPPTVYGYFRSKDELLLAIVAEDLAALAALMRQGSGFVEQPSVEDEPTDDAPAATGERFDGGDQLCSNGVAPVRRDTVDKPSSVDTEVHGDFTQAATGAETAHSDRSAATDAGEPNSARPQFPDDRPRVDAWLERRLRVFERALADLERRMTESESGAAGAGSRAEEDARSLLERLGALENRQTELQQLLLQRTEAGERRQRSMAAEMRAALNDANGRLERLESPDGVVHVRGELPPDRDSDFGLADVQPTSDEAAAFGLEGRHEQNTYLAAARRAASAAATLTEMVDREPLPKSAWQRFVEARVRLSRKQNLMTGAATAILFLIGGYVGFHVGEARGRISIVTVTPHAAVAARHLPMSVTPTKSTSATPLDRLSNLANSGNSKAQLLIGLRYLHGEGVSANAPRAADWIKRAAEQHEPLAQYWLGSLYERGEGVNADPVEALRWYAAAAGQGNRKAMHSLGLAYAQGEGVGKDLSEAARWFQRAATLGYVNSQFNLAVLYERGDGVQQSLRDAFKWYSVAASSGDAESRTRVEALKMQLPADDVAQASREAANFHPADIDREANDAPAVANPASDLR